MAAVSVYENTLAAEARAVRAALERTAAECRRRQMVTLIDLALDECEAVNLARLAHQPLAAVPACVLDLLDRLWRLGLPVHRPADCVEAHEMLLDLQARYLRGSPISSAEEAAWADGDERWLAGRREGRW
jgi:hypothetical protein